MSADQDGIERGEVNLIQATVPAHLACKICLINKGLKGSEIHDLPTTEREFYDHLRTEHNIIVTDRGLERGADRRGDRRKNRPR